MNDRKAKKTDKKSRFLQKTRKRYVILKFLDPYQNYHLYGDVVLSNKLWQSNKELVFPFYELYLDYKALRQIYIRPNGVIFELEDFYENIKSPIPLLKARLKSLGDTNASTVADFLDYYESYFHQEDLSESTSKTPLILKTKPFSEEQMFDWVDKIFEENKENVTFIKGNKLLKNRDSRTRYLCYNSKLLQWLTREKDVFNEQFIKDCLCMSYHTDLEGFLQVLKGMVIDKYQTQAKSKILPKSFNTLLGKVNLLMEFDTVAFEEQRMFFYISTHNKSNFEPNLISRFQNMSIEQISKKNVEGKMNFEFELDRRKTENYSQLMKSYYCWKKK